jgi:hypothetical protein
MTVHIDHATACAAEIVALINASPRTPGIDEIAAIIARSAPPFSADDPLAEEWERARAAFEGGCADPAREDDDADELLRRLAEATLAIWRRGARSDADHPLFVRLARYWNADDPELDADLQALLVLSPYGLDKRSLAQLVYATLKVAGQRK